MLEQLLARSLAAVGKFMNNIRNRLFSSLSPSVVTGETNERGKKSAK